MTKIQHKYFVAIRKFIAENGYAPSFAEVADVVGVRSLATISSRIHQLVDQGYLTLTQHGRINNIRTLPEDCADLVTCNRGHVSIWFRTPFCPLCELLNRIRPPAPPPDLHQS